MSGPKRPRPKCPWPKCPTFALTAKIDISECLSLLQLMAQFRIFPSSESRHSFVANYTSAVKFKIHILVLFCCIIIPLYVSESKYL